VPFAQQRGPHVVAAFDPAEVSGAQLTQAAREPGVQAAAGPFAQATVELPDGGMSFGLGSEITVVGRAGSPTGPRTTSASGAQRVAGGE
jgi:putative ABC transport system permease protein